MLATNSSAALSAPLALDIGAPPGLAEHAEPRGVTVIDLDRTLTRTGTFSPFLLHAARLNSPWRLVFVPVVLLAMGAYKARLISRKRLKEVMARLMLGPSIDGRRLDELAARFAATQLRRNCYPAGLALVEEEKRQGRIVVLATAAHRFYAEAIAREFGIDLVVATESRRAGDAVLPAIEGANCYGEAKRARIEHLLAALGLPRSRSSVRCYSDDVSDLPLFSWSDEPIAVNPSRELRAHARRNGWRILDW